MVIMKDVYFLAGLHRSGNTVLASILNQHPKVFVPSVSPVCEYMWAIDELSCSFETAIISNKPERSQNVISNIVQNYYYNIDKPIVIEKDKNWATPPNIKLIRRYITPNPKIIFTVRPILEILASLIQIDPNAIKIDMERNNWLYKTYLSESDNMCDFLMRPRGPLDITMLSYNSLKDPELSSFIHVVEYKDLIASPEKIMINLNAFLNLEDFDYDFNNIVLNEEYNDAGVGFSTDLHKINKSIQKSSTDPNNILSDYVINKYSNFQYFQ